MQERSAVAEPAAETKVPGVQLVLSTQVVAGLPSLSHVSFEHGTAGVEPPAQNSPGMHVVHFVVPLSKDPATVPAGQLLLSTQAAWFTCVDEVPDGQAAHRRSLTWVGGLDT
jgi:hypothetical protein